MKRKRDKQYHIVRIKYDDLLWGSLILVFGTRLLTNPMQFSQNTQITLYCCAGFLIALYICLSYGEIFKKK
ncbi:MAG: hypothetical protein ACOX66_02620 [Oscillospiraceae bacterium]|jgi:hypothetical protein